MPSRQRFFCHRMEGSVVCVRKREHKQVWRSDGFVDEFTCSVRSSGVWMGLDKCTVGIEANRSIELIQN